jgi:hypothetical protein
MTSQSHADTPFPAYKLILTKPYSCVVKTASGFRPARKTGFVPHKTSIILLHGARNEDMEGHMAILAT